MLQRAVDVLLQAATGLAIVLALTCAWVTVFLLTDESVTQAELFSVNFTLPFAPLAAAGWTYVAVTCGWLLIHWRRRQNEAIGKLG